MSVGEIVFMVAVVAVALLMTVLKGKVPAWLGFLLMLIASIVVIVGSAVTGGYKAIPLGVAGVIGTILVWIFGATSQPATNPDLPGGDDGQRRDDPDTLGGVASRVRWWTWLVVAVLVVGGFGLSFAIPDAPSSNHTAPSAQHNHHS